MYSTDALCNALLTDTPTLNKISLTDDIDIILNFLTSAFTNCLSQCALLVTQEIKRPPAPWMYDEFRSTLAVLNTLQWLLKLGRYNEALQEQYKHERNGVKSLLRKAGQQYYRQQFLNNRGNSAATCKCNKNIMPSKKSTNNSNFERENELDRAEEVNELFVAVGKRTFEKRQNNLSDMNHKYDNTQENETYENVF